MSLTLYMCSLRCNNSRSISYRHSLCKQLLNSYDKRTFVKSKDAITSAVVLVSFTFAALIAAANAKSATNTRPNRRAF